MIVQLSDDRRIQSTEHSWQLERKRTRAGKTEWTPYKWFSTFRGALGAAGDEAIRILPAQDLAEAIEAVSQLTTRYAELFEVNLSKAQRHELGMRVVQ